MDCECPWANIFITEINSGRIPHVTELSDCANDVFDDKVNFSFGSEAPDTEP